MCVCVQCVGAVVEFSIRILTLLMPVSLKAIFYHSTLVLFVAVIIGRCVRSHCHLDMFVCVTAA